MVAHVEERSSLMWSLMRFRVIAAVASLQVACSDDVTEAVGDDSSSSTDPTSSTTSTMSTTDETSTITSADTSSTTEDPTTDESSSSSTSETDTDAAACGNGIVEDGEQCDGENLDGQDCASLELGNGTLACGDTCMFDPSGCTTRSCGNDEIEGAEVCDGMDLGSEDCISQGFEAGLLFCNDDCSALDPDGCLNVPSCVEQDIGSVVGDAAAVGATFDEDPDYVPSCTFDLSPQTLVLWVAPADGTWVFDSNGSDFDVTLAAYTDCGEKYEIGCTYDWGGGFGAQLSLGLEAGDAVIISVGGLFGSTGNWQLDINELGAGAGGCCFPNGGIGCSDETCQDQVCQALPECCQFGWSQQCSNVADVFCEVCNTPDVCGNGEAEDGEACDGDDFGGETCVSQGFDGGALACAADCSGLDTSGCIDYDGSCCAAHPTPGCTDEECVDLVCSFDSFCCDFQWDGFCQSLAQQNCTICNTPDVCGNGILDGVEACDEPDLGGETCQSQGFDGGTIGCLDDCSAIDISSCADFGGDCCAEHDGPGCDDATCTEQVCLQYPYCCEVEWDLDCELIANFSCEVCGVEPFCGNNNVEPPEACDSQDLEGLDCTSFGFAGGTLFCAFDCSGYDTSSCFEEGGDCCVAHGGPSCDDQACADTVCLQQPWCCDQQWDFFCADAAADLCQVCGAFGCGDPYIEPGDEVCDGPLLGGETCATPGFDYGALACSGDCDSFDTSGCLEYAGNCCAADGTPGCDNVACTAQVCAADASCCNGPWDQGCADLANALCNACDPGACGNGSIELGETCDGVDLNGESCQTQGFDGGALACDGDCGGYDASACEDFSGDCCDPAGDATPGCDDLTCSDAVCAIDPSCCTDAWGPQCTAIATDECAVCGAFFDFSGVINDVPVDDLLGWTPCWIEPYSGAGSPIGVVQQLCSGGNLLLGCRFTGDDTLLVAANAPREDVFFDTDQSNVPHDANGVGWYYDQSFSWGFAPQGVAIQRQSCDVLAGNQRVCWPTSNGTLNNGFRCGDAQGLLQSNAYERVIFERP